MISRRNKKKDEGTSVCCFLLGELVLSVGVMIRRGERIDCAVVAAGHRLGSFDDDYASLTDHSDRDVRRYIHSRVMKADDWAHIDCIVDWLMRMDKRADLARMNHQTNQHVGVDCADDFVLPQWHSAPQYSQDFRAIVKSFLASVAIDPDKLRSGATRHDHNRPLIALLIGRDGDNPRLDFSVPLAHRVDGNCN